MEIKEVKRIGDKYVCDIGISTEEWIEILQDSNFMTSNYKDALLKFYNEPGHKSTCKNLGEKYGKNPRSFTSLITRLAEAVQKRLNKFKVIGTDGEETFWIIPMTGKKTGSNFEWTIRPELVEAIEKSGILSYDPIKEIIDHYKNHIKNGGLEDELYKWELINMYKGLPDISAENFANEINSVDLSNLVYQIDKAIVKNASDRNPEEYRALFKKLFDEKLSLETRVIEFLNGFKAFYLNIFPDVKIFHEERTISTFLTYHNPEKYTFYKSSYYSSFCNLLGVKPKPAKKKYVHYLELIDELIKEYIIKDEELLQIVDEELSKGDYYPDKNRKILAQDILYQMLDKKNEETQDQNYWFFQANPNYYKIFDALQDNVLNQWQVNQFKKEIKENDKVILWVTGENAGVYALATITSPVSKLPRDEFELNHYGLKIHRLGLD